MVKQPPSDAEHQRKYAEAISKAKTGGMDSFQCWFDRSQDANQSLTRGYWDLAIHILTPKVCEHIEIPEEKIALEIGYGGGRILNAACSLFREVIGIDIHDEQEMVECLLKSQGKNNFRLIKTSGNSIDVDSESIDFIYSFIVLQHLPSLDVLISYLEETYRCLKPGGVAQLFFGKYSSKLSKMDQLRHLLRGYKELPEAPVNHTSLVVRVSKMKRLCKNIGFEVAEAGSSFKRVPDGYRSIKGGQNFVTLLRKH